MLRPSRGRVRDDARILDPEAKDLPPSEYHVLFVNVGGDVTCHIRKGEMGGQFKQTAQIELNMYTMRSIKGEYVEYARALCRAEKLEKASKALLQANKENNTEAIATAQRDLYEATFQPVNVVERYYDGTILQPKWVKINGELQSKVGVHHETKGSGS